MNCLFYSPCVSNIPPSTPSTTPKVQGVSHLSFTNTPKHNSKVTGMVAKACKGSLRQPQKIFLFLLPEIQKGKTKRVFFGLPLQHCPPTCVHQALCIVVYSIVKWLAGGWSFTSASWFASVFLI